MPISSSSDYATFFLGTKSSVVQIECMVFDHIAFDPIYLVRNVAGGVTISGRSYTYYPMQIRNATTSDDVDYKMEVTFGDLGEIMPQLLDQVADNGLMDVRPTAQYRAFRSDTMDAIIETINMEVTSISFNETGCVLVCSAPSINRAKVGEFYTVDRFPMLAGFT